MLCLLLYTNSSWWIWNCLLTCKWTIYRGIPYNKMLDPPLCLSEIESTASSRDRDTSVFRFQFEAIVRSIHLLLLLSCGKESWWRHRPLCHGPPKLANSFFKGLHSDCNICRQTSMWAPRKTKALWLKPQTRRASFRAMVTQVSQGDLRESRWHCATAYTVRVCLRHGCWLNKNQKKLLYFVRL